MSDLELVRWKRYGRDQLYVKASDGRDVGWVDLLTDQRTLSDPAYEQAFNDAVERWRVAAATVASGESNPAPAPLASTLGGATAQTDGPSMPLPPIRAAEPSPPAARPWHDIAGHKPGQAAREQAARHLAAMKQRTKAGTLLARAFDVRTEERAWRVGASGEEAVGSRLEKLTLDGWRVLHAVPVGRRGSDIDHVVIGPGGVYTINTKNHPGGRVWVAARAIRVNGQPVPYLRNSQHEGQRAARLLSRAVGFPVHVRPALVFLTGGLLPNVTIKQKPEDVAVLDRLDIPGAFKRAPRRLAPEQVDVIFEAARRCTTWTGSPSCTCLKTA